jgi:hypothetical protein
MTSAFRQYSDHTFTTFFSLDLAVTKRDTSAELNRNSKPAIDARSQMNVVKLPLSAMTGAEPNIARIMIEVKKTVVAAIVMLVAIVFHLIRPPRHLKLSDVNADSSIASRIYVSPPYIKKASMIAASEIVTWIFIRGSWMRSAELEKTAATLKIARCQSRRSAGKL